MKVSLSPGSLLPPLKAGPLSPKAIESPLEQLATGKQINHARDNPSGLLSAEYLRRDLSDLQYRLSGYGRLQITLEDRTYREATVQGELHHLSDRIVQAAGFPTSLTERLALQEEVDTALDTIDRLRDGDGSRELGSRLVETYKLAAGEEANLVDGDPQLAAEVVEQASLGSAFRQAALGAEQRQLDVLEQIDRDRQVIAAQSLSEVEDTDFLEATGRLAAATVLTKTAFAAQLYSQQARTDLLGSLLDRREVA